MVKTTGNELLKCCMCGSYFNKKCYLDNHILKYHNNPTEMTNVNRNLKPIVNKMPTKNQVVITKVQGQNKKIQLQLPPTFLLCPICGSYFTQKFRLDKHMAQVHEPKPQQNLVQTLYQCSVCNTCYKEKSELEFHSALAHGKGQYQCGDCSATFDTESDLMQHYSSVHEETSPAQLGHAQLDQAQLGHTQLGHAQSSHAQLGQAAQMRNVYVGPALIPGYTQTSQATGQTKRQVINIKVHEENKLFYCPHGCIGAKSKENLTEHLIEYHTNGRYQCDICKSRFHREEQLTAHTILEHRGIPKFQSLRTLNSIESVFTEPPKAVVHVNQSDIAKFKCHLCYREFSHKTDFDLHRKTFHENANWAYKCKVCDEGFTSKPCLANHFSMVHEKKKQYPCTLCDASFSLEQILYGHIEAFHGQK